MQNIKNLSTEQRIEICKKCPIYAPNRGICNSKLWINPDTNETSTHAKAGFIKGCGCNIHFKTKSTSNHCIAGKW